uniref:Uncharacterized protein n=1 Tax=Pectobacterium carotovorum TaxID=554 RepID=A0A0N9NMS8_PECCA|nr:hypothetical protein [Pectobacterium carotovorum]ALG88546.1 Hypothetical protein [Pectobacterium carotovorum]
MSTKIKKISLLVLVLVLVLVLACIYIYYKNTKKPSFVCDSHFYIVNESKDLSAEIKITLHNSKTESYFLELGTLTYKGHTFIIDKKANIDIISKLHGQHYEIRRIGYTKNPDDNLPDAITDMLTTKMEKTTVKFEKNGKNTLIINDLKRTIMICALK